ncbi:MAG: DUF1189 family protein [Candidatus Omnitrophica bacterium]|nr:DUF1189 family protein [Candidatus Omnitrophota bacterium]
MSFWQTPFFALFRLDLYRRAAGEKISKGFFYLVYLSVLMGVFSVMAYNIRAVPEVKDFVEWFKADMPASLVWTPQGLQMPLQAPYAMVHEKYGPLVLFDLQKDETTAAQMKDYPVLVTARKIYLRPVAGSGNIRSYDITAQGLTEDTNQLSSIGPVQITPALVQKTYDSMRPWILLIVFSAVLVIFFVWKVMAALFYSWFALLMNMRRHDKLDYSQLLNISILALTPAIAINLLRLFIPPLEFIPFGFAGSFIVTMGYLFWVLKKTDVRPA